MDPAARWRIETWLLFALLLSPLPLSAGQFQSPTYYKAAIHPRTYPYSVAVGDFNNDTFSDLAVADYFESQVRILINKRDGTFAVGNNFSVSVPVALAIADLNEDGRPDILVVESGGSGNGTLGIYLGNGDGTFHKGGSHPLGPFVGSIAVADFNRDGHVDVAASYGVSKPAGVILFFGDGKGKLKKDKTYKFSGELGGIAAGDLNGDGYPDLAVAEYEGECVAVLLNDGSGKLGTPTCYPTAGPSPAIYVAIADLNHDKIPDLVVATPSVEPGFNAFLGTGNGQFGTAIYTGSMGAFSLTIADFDRDGTPDIVAADTTKSAILFHGIGDGTFHGVEAIQTKYPCGLSVASGDFDNDRAPDLAITMYNRNKVAVLLNRR